MRVCVHRTNYFQIENGLITKFPSSHSHPHTPHHYTYTTAPPSINSPDAHVHASADTDAAGADELVGHGRHALMPAASAKALAPHVVQAEEPVALAKAPRPQGVGADTPSGQKDPSGHGTGAPPATQ